MDKTNLYNLYIPNEEIKEVFEREIIARSINSNVYTIASKFRNALLTGKVEDISEILFEFIISSFSYYDLRNEKDYQILITALLAGLFNDYLVKSEVNNTFGRCDIMLLPKNNKNIGIIIEIKKYKGRLSLSKFETNATLALNQIIDKEYFKELKKLNCRQCLLYAFIFDDRRNYIKTKEK